MGNKIFVSYKYKDNDVEHINGIFNTTTRDYVDIFQSKLESSDHIYKGEDDNDDLSDFSDDETWEKLKDRIYDSSVTVVFISPNMREKDKYDKSQWIPWEISYSLKEVSRKNEKGDPITSRSNAIVAVVLPDINGKYDYYIINNSCCDSRCRTLKTENLFTILCKNMFNKKDDDKYKCDKGSIIHRGESSYIESVKWNDFIYNYNNYINKAIKRQDNIDDYNIQKEI